MKLLFDQNISHRILNHIQDILPEAKQLRDLGLENNSTNRSGNMQKKALI